MVYLNCILLTIVIYISVLCIKRSHRRVSYNTLNSKTARQISMIFATLNSSSLGVAESYLNFGNVNLEIDCLGGAIWTQGKIKVVGCLINQKR